MKLSLNVTLASLGIVSLLFVGISCGKLQPKSLDTVSLRVPDYSVTQDFSLSGDSGSRRFFGQVLIWDPAVQPQSVAQVLTLKRQANEASVERLRSLNAFVSGVLEPASKELIRLKANKDRVALDAAPRVRAQSLGLAKQWLESELVAHIPETESRRVSENARSVFGAYCEARLWAFATSKALAHFEYVERPTPLAVCEGVYAERGFFNNPSCESSLNSKNYFECFWSGAIFKTRFASRYSPEQKRILGELAQRSELKKIFAGDVDAECTIVKIRGQNRIRTKANSETIANHVLSGAKNQEISCNGVNASFSMGEPNSDVPLLYQASPAKVFGDLESRSVNCETMFCFVPPTLADGSVSSQKEQAWGKKLSAQLMALSAQSLTCDGILPSWFTKNFVSFNEPIMSSPLGVKTCNEPAESELPPIFARDAELESAIKEVATALTDFAQQKRKACLNSNADCDVKSANSVLAAKERDASEKASVAALKRGVAVAIVPSFGVNTRTQDGFDVVDVILEGVKSRSQWTACLKAGAMVNCPAHINSGENKILSAVFFHPDTRILSFDLRIEDPKLFGHQEYGVHSAVLRDFSGALLRVELVPGKMGQYLPYVSGMVSILKNDTVVYQGVAYAVDAAKSEYHERIFYSH